MDTISSLETLKIADHAKKGGIASVFREKTETRVEVDSVNRILCQEIAKEHDPCDIAH